MYECTVGHRPPALRRRCSMSATSSTATDALLVKYLNEAYGKERQLETALKAQIGLVHRPTLREALIDHLGVTRDQIEGLRARIAELDGTASSAAGLATPGVAQPAAAAATSLANKALAAAKGPLQALRGTSAADNELRNARDCYWNEAEEIAHYRVIEAVAGSLGDATTLELAREYREQEEQMQALLEAEVPALVADVMRAELPEGA